VMMTLPQLLAAKTADLDRLVMHVGDPSGREPAEPAMAGLRAFSASGRLSAAPDRGSRVTKPAVGPKRRQLTWVRPHDRLETAPQIGLVGIVAPRG
jgi:hypothetical protein